MGSPNIVIHMIKSKKLTAFIPLLLVRFSKSLHMVLAMTSFMFSGQYHIIEPNKQKADELMKQACEEAKKTLAIRFIANKRLINPN